jgi:hypothetical protein
MAKAYGDIPDIGGGTAGPTVTDYHAFPDRGHSLVLDHGWREVADLTLSWLARQGLALLFLSRQSCRWRGVTVGLFGITDGVYQAEYDEITARLRGRMTLTVAGEAAARLPDRPGPRAASPAVSYLLAEGQRGDVP